MKVAMDMTFENENLLSGRASRRRECKAQEPEWHALRARLIAAQDMRKALAEELKKSLVLDSGSFASALSSGFCHDDKGYAGINQNDSAHLKPDACMDADIVGNARIVDRGIR